MTSEWQVMGGNIVLFLAPSQISLPESLKLYSDVWQKAPDQFQRQPNPLIPSIAMGRGSGMTLQCSTHPSRIDFGWQPLPPKKDTNLKPRAIEEPDSFLTSVKQVISFLKDGAIANPVNRVALTLQFVNFQNSTKDANAAITKIIPQQYGIKVLDEEDFIFQVNTPYVSQKKKALQMSSIAKWSVDKIHIVSLFIPVGFTFAPGQSIQPPLPQEFIAASILLDNNSSASNQNILSSTEQSEILDESLQKFSISQKNFGLNIEGF